MLISENRVKFAFRAKPASRRLSFAPGVKKRTAKVDQLRFISFKTERSDDFRFTQICNLFSSFVHPVDFGHSR
jgi:hypothetical protein